MKNYISQSEAKNTGALIESGPEDWQILQRQPDGTSGLTLSGTWASADPVTAPVVKVRIVLEDTGETIVPWTSAEMGGDRTWKAMLAVPQGGLYRIETCLSAAEQPAVEWSTRGDMIHHVGVGDVFVITGQSNAAGYGKDPVCDPPEIGIHLLGNNVHWRLATHPLNESTDTAHPVNRESANPGHSPWLSFAKRLRREINVPVGLIQVSLGGSPLSAWNPEEGGSLYRNMMDVLDCLRTDDATASPSVRLIRGVLWYQGCSDTAPGVCDTYLERFGRFVAHLRKDLGDPELPFLTVQIGRYAAGGDPSADTGWGKVREAQRQASRIYAGIAVVPALDLPLSDVIHISAAGNMVLGERAAKAFLGAFYGVGTGFRAPEPVSAIKSGDGKVHVRFEHITERLYGFEIPPGLSPFIVEQADGTLLVPCAATYTGKDEVELAFECDIGTGCHLHGAHRQNAYPMIPIDVSTRLPMLSFCGFPIEEQTM
jgi:sialate O-acetylesterase